MRVVLAWDVPVLMVTPVCVQTVVLLVVLVILLQVVVHQADQVLALHPVRLLLLPVAAVVVNVLLQLPLHVTPLLNVQTLHLILRLALAVWYVVAILLALLAAL